MKWISTEPATIAAAKERLANRIADLPIWVRWYRTYDNPHGGGPFGKSKEYCTCELIGVTAKRLTLKDGKSTCHVDPKSCFFAVRQETK
jgi:hypothetical protein